MIEQPRPDWYLRLVVRVSPPASFHNADLIARRTAQAIGHDLFAMGRSDNYRLLSVSVSGSDPAPPIPVPPEYVEALHDAVRTVGLTPYPAPIEDIEVTRVEPKKIADPDLIDARQFAELCGISPQRIYELESARGRTVADGLGHAFPAPFVTGWWHRHQAEAFAATRRTQRGPRRRSPNCNVEGCETEGAAIVGSMGRGRRIEAWVCPAHERFLGEAVEGRDWVLHVVPSTKVVISPQAELALDGAQNSGPHEG